MTTATTTSGAAIQRYKSGYHADEWGQRSSTPRGIPDASGSWVRYADHVNALAAGQATAAQAVVQDDLITIRKPTTSAELLWLLKLAHLVISDVDKTLEAAFAPAQPAAQQGVAYADAHGTIMGAAYDFRDAHISGSPNQKRSAHAALESAVTNALRASHGQAPAQPDQPIACSYGDNGYACCEGGPCQADVHNDKLAEQQAPATAQSADSVPAPAPPPECETEAEKRAFAFGWFKALESERMKADNKKKDPL